MVNISISDLAKLADNCFRRAHRAATSIKLSHITANSEKFSKSYQYSEASQTIQDDPEFSGLDYFEGMKAWGAMLSFDLRGSSKLPEAVGAKNTYILMHTYLPTMLAVVKASRGRIVGLRGDGAIAMFGVVKYPNEEHVKIKPEEAEKAVSEACDCGASMVKAIIEVINPILIDGKVVKKPIEIGIGIDVGEFVATNIGLGTAHELTAYGGCVNTACHTSEYGYNEVILTLKAKAMFPTATGGRTGFRKLRDIDGYVLEYPNDYLPLKH